MKPSKAVIAGAAVAGLLSGSLAVRTYAASTPSHEGVPLRTTQLLQKSDCAAMHACKGRNECKGQGGGENWGKNECKGKGGCATVFPAH